jgi:hypothetical protein
MPLPILAWGAAVLVGAAIAKSSKKKGYAEGYSRAEEESQARINELTRKLTELQKQREYVKDQFRDVVDHMSSLDINDKGFFPKIATFLKGYSHFHIYVVGIISVARYRCLELGLPASLSDELRGIVLGFIQGGFPDNLKKDVNEVWGSTDMNAVHKKLTYCRERIPKELAGNFARAVEDIGDAVNGLYNLHKQESSVKREIQKLREAV